MNPTGAKLIAGLGLGATAVIAAYLYSVMKNDYRIGEVFIGGNFIVGLVVGWVTLGRRPGKTNLGGMIAGLFSLVGLLIASALVFSLLFIMGNLAQANMHDPMDLPLLMMDKSIGFIREAVLDMPVLASLLVGGALTGWATFQASIRWR